MRFEELSHMMQKPDPKPDTYEAGMAQNQLLKIGSHAIRLHNMIDNDAEMESWVAKKIDLASNYVKSVHGYTAGSKAGTYDDDGMSEISKMPKGTGTMQGVKEDAGTMDWSTDKVKEFGDALIQLAKGQVPSDDLQIDDLEDGWAGADQDSRDQMAETIGARLMNVLVGYLQFSAGQKPSTDDVKDAQGVVNDPEFKKAYHSNESAVQEDAGEMALAKQMAELYDNVLEWITDTDNAETDDEADYGDGYTDADYNDATDLAKTFREKGMQAGLKLHKELLAKRKRDGFSSFAEWDPLNPEADLYYAAKKILARYKESTPEDSGELARLKELSGIEENAKVNFSPEQIKQLMMWNKKYSVYSGKNGDELPSGLVKANTDSGITSDGYEENEVKQYEKMFGKEEFDWDDSQHGEFQEKSKITGGMMSDLEKIVGVGNADDEYTLAEIGEKILGSSFGDTYEEQYQPFPEGDEFDIAEDEDFEEVLGPLGFPEDETELFDAEYQGRKVPLNKPMRGDVKKFKVYVKDPSSGNVKKVNFGHGGTSAKKLGQKTMKIRKSNPKARKSFRARHNCANPGPKTKARYWSCRKW